MDRLIASVKTYLLKMSQLSNEPMAKQGDLQSQKKRRESGQTLTWQNLNESLVLQLEIRFRRGNFFPKPFQHM